MSLAHAEGREAAAPSILNGHIDTVEVGDTAAWTAAPLGGDIVDGRLIGRGSCDMKGGLVGNLYALRALHEAGMAPVGDVIVESTISEEDGGAGALAAILRGYVADAALIAEPTNLAVIVAHGGSLMFRLHVPGLSAHACVRDEGISAIENFAYLHRGLLDFESRHNRQITHPLDADMFNKAPLNIGKIWGGAWASSVPEAVVAEGRAGLVPGEDLETLKSQLVAEMDELADADPWLRSHRPRFEWLHGQFAPADVPTNHPFVSAVQVQSPRSRGPMSRSRRRRMARTCGILSFRAACHASCLALGTSGWRTRPTNRSRSRTSLPRFQRWRYSSPTGAASSRADPKHQFFRITARTADNLRPRCSHGPLRNSALT